MPYFVRPSETPVLTRNRETGDLRFYLRARLATRRNRMNLLPRRCVRADHGNLFFDDQSGLPMEFVSRRLTDRVQEMIDTVDLVEDRFPFLRVFLSDRPQRVAFEITAHLFRDH